MINYEYLTCTDSDGNSKEINFVPGALPSTAKTEYTLLALYEDTKNSKLLHVKQINAPVKETWEFQLEDGTWVTRDVVCFIGSII